MSFNAAGLAPFGALAILTASGLAQPLTVDPDLVTGELDNGLSYIILEHANPPGRANMYLHVSTGSLNETEQTRGIAHFLEHMAFNGGTNIPPGEVIPYFESLSMSFGQHLNAFTSFDQTAYTLSLPDTEIGTLKKGFLFYEDVLFGMLLLAEEIDEERGVIMEELRTGQGPDQRVRDQIFEKLAPGSTFGRRLPIGTEETINGVTREDFVNYYTKWYTPSNSTLIIAGDFEAKDIEAAVRETFNRGERTPRPVDLDPGIEAYTQMRAIVATDDELTDAEVGFIGIEEERAPVTTEAQFRARLVESMATQAFNRRLGAKINEDAVSFTSGAAMAMDLFDAMHLTQLSVQGDASDWETMLREAATELRRARLHGFTQREIDDVRRAAIAAAERTAERADTMPAGARLAGLNSAIATGATPISAEESLRLVRKYADSITPEEVSVVFNELFDDRAVTTVLELPTSADVPDENELLAMAQEALSVTPEAEEEADRPSELMAQLPEPGEIVSLTEHEATGVATAWMDNNVCVHHREMTIQEDQVTVSIALAGGEIMEDESNRGVSEAAALAWNRPATDTLSSTNIRDLMTGSKVGVGGGSGTDVMSLSVSGSPAELERGLQLAHLLLTRPRIESAAFDQWKQERVLQIQQNAKTPNGQVMEAMADALLPEGETRRRPLTEEQVGAITLDQAQAWLDRVIREAPIEVSVVGDLDRRTALELTARYLGSLSERERISESVLDGYREIGRQEGPRVVIREVETQTPVAIALAGSFGTSIDEVRDRRALNLAAQIMTTRLIARVREAEQQVYSISAQSIPGVEYPELGLFFAASATGPGNGERLTGVIHEMFGELAEKGPSAEEVETARAQVLNTLDEQIKQPGFWSAQLSGLVYRGRDLGDIETAPEMYRSFSAGDVQEVFKRYYTEDRQITVIVKPKGAGESAGEGAEETDG
ncbi:MAG: M16 family metallopeptidase [Phycisphaerales bacterium JB059]